MNRVCLSRKSDEWSTPQATFDALNEEFHFTLDPCATRENAKCERFFTIADDGLTQPWTGCVFMNPPQSKVKTWITKARREAAHGALVVCLVPARTDTRWFHDEVLGKAEIRFIRGRLKFSGSLYNAPFPSMVIVFRPPTAKEKSA